MVADKERVEKKSAGVRSFEKLLAKAKLKSASARTWPKCHKEPRPDAKLINDEN